MKRLIFLSIIFFITSCSSNKKSVEILKQNITNYKALLTLNKIETKEAIIFISKKKNSYHIAINPKNIEKDIKLINCYINNSKTTITKAPPLLEANWTNNYKIYLPTSTKKIKSRCILSNNEAFSLN